MPDLLRARIQRSTGLSAVRDDTLKKGVLLLDVPEQAGFGAGLACYSGATVVVASWKVERVPVAASVTKATSPPTSTSIA